MVNRGFTIVELIITITIMGILILLAVVSVNTTQLSSRDDERRTDTESIQVNLESYFSGSSVGDNSLAPITNLAPNPVARTSLSGWTASSTGGASGTNTMQSSGGPTGVTNSYLRRTTSSVATSSPLAIAAVGTGTSAIPVTQNTTYSISGYMRTSFALSNGYRIDLTQYDASGVSLGDADGTIDTNRPQIANTWQRVSRTVTTVPGTAFLRVRFIFSGPVGAPVGSTFDVTGVMVTQGTNLYDFADGTYAKWGWNGTADASSSSGTPVTSNNPGTYPSISLAAPNLLTSYLPDADTKVFTAPGKSGPEASLVAATNSLQSTTGVLPQPTIDQYVYQPIDGNGQLCISRDCRKFNVYYRLEKDNSVYMISSKNQ